MAVDDNVDLILLEHTQVDLRNQRARRAKEDIRDVRCQHGTAPTVREGAAHGLVQDVLGVLVVAHVGAVEHFDHLAIDTAGGKVQFLPQLVALLRGTAQVGKLALLLAEFCNGLIGDVVGDVKDWASLRRNAQVFRHRLQFIRIADLEALSLVFGDGLERERQVAAVVRVGGAAGGHMAGKVAGANGLEGSAADADLAVLGDAAGTHQAHRAAHAPAADRTRSHALGTRERGAEVQRFRPMQQLDGGGIGAELLGGFCFLFRHDRS